MNVTDGERALLLTSREAAKALSISERTLWTLTKAGLVQVVRIGRAVRYSLADLEAHGSEKEIRQAGKLRVEGKQYVMQDGDICHFLFNV